MTILTTIDYDLIIHYLSDSRFCAITNNDFIHKNIGLFFITIGKHQFSLQSIKLILKIHNQATLIITAK